MSAWNDAMIRAALERALPGVSLPHDLAPRALSGGLTARSFVIRVGDAEVVARLPIGGAPPLLDLQTEAAAMRAAAAAGLAPRVLGLDTSSGMLITEYLADAPAWTRDAACEPANIARIAELLRKLHALDAPAPPFAAYAIAQRYVAAAAPNGGTDAPWAVELVARARDFDERHTGAALCHNDLFAANVLDDGRRLMLVDFEYAVRASPLLDLAGFAAMNDLPHERRMLLLAEYHRTAPTARATDELDGAVRLVRLLAYFWAVLGRKLGGVNAQEYAALCASVAETLQRERI